MERYFLKSEISISAVRDNIKLLRSMLEPTTLLCAVVKSACYGHGWEPLLESISAQSDFLAVATPTEALGLRNAGCTGPVLMFFSASAYADGQEMLDALDELIRADITITVANSSDALCVNLAAGRLAKKANIHVKIDTGMSRSGISPDKAKRLFEQIQTSEHINLTGIYTHFATADENDKTFTKKQFQRLLDTVSACGSFFDRENIILHAANSAAVIDLPETQLDMVRPGIALYGYQPSNQMLNHPALTPALRLSARLMQVKDIPAGSGASYGLTHIFDKPARVGLVPIGYGDGYPRELSNKSQMRIRRQFAPVRGRVCMDQTIIDLTDVPGASVGDEVEIYSPDATAPNSVENLAALAGTISYELLCRLGKRIKRTVTTDGH